mmetsp:Transcript_89151/g.277135  ORF Transcript_89151/g.277135 Transcript_89151/m.277135 type:complete len:204 (+) Transcript_89151:141-752(+)
MMSKPLPSFFAWWLRMTRLRPFRAQKALVTFQAKREMRLPEDERGDSCTPNTSCASASSSIGSDQRMSLTQVISGLLRSSPPIGLRSARSWPSLQVPPPMPPCTTRMRPSMRHASGIRSKALCIRSKTFGPKVSPSRRRHCSSKPYRPFMRRSSWLPRTSQTRSGSRTLRHRRRQMTSSWWAPRSTKSPLKTNIGASGTSGLP